MNPLAEDAYGSDLDEFEDDSMLGGVPIEMPATTSTPE